MGHENPRQRAYLCTPLWLEEGRPAGAPPGGRDPLRAPHLPENRCPAVCEGAAPALADFTAIGFACAVEVLGLLASAARCASSCARFAAAAAAAAHIQDQRSLKVEGRYRPVQMQGDAAQDPRRPNVSKALSQI
ncbi:uncharacterized protein LOC120681003 [Panicum virgatum]|uniref:uncharacterized protein LOC120681003 n=1 Tax=Panicum virgatum TaxID=38727 RepID=UPI0019D5E15D|nr:uncharacterized protein LOC120681003 [Panicum virgatum]